MKQFRWMRCVLALLLVCAVALSLPMGARAAGESTNRFNVVIVLDASGSMKDTDPNGYRYEAISQFTGLLAERGNVLGCVVFHTQLAAQKELISISSQADKDAVMEVLESVPAKNGWTNTGAGLAKAVEMISAKADPSLPSVILFLSDGNTELSNEEDTQASLELKAEALQSAREEGIRIYSVCLNADKSADVSEMRQLADATGGEFQEVTKAEDLQAVFNTFYNLIYGTSTITLVDDKFGSNGRLETTFEVPGIGVEEVNIIVYGNTTKLELLRPDGTKSPSTAVVSNTFTMLKLTDVVPGKWKLISEGVPGDSIKINMVYNTNLSVELAVGSGEQVITPAEPVTVTARLKGATSGDQYLGYSAQLQLFDAYGELLKTVPMEVVGDRFEVKHTFAEGTYFCKVAVKGNYIEKESAKVGPLVCTKAVEEVKKNSAPVPVKDVVEKGVKIWPFKGGSLELDLTTLATDADGDALRFKVESSSFIEGTDYTVDSNSVLSMDHFSLSKGAFTVSATDGWGESCTIEVIVKTYNIGLITLIGIGILALIGAAIFGILLYIALSKPFRGTISAQSYSNGAYKGTPRNPRRGREKLARFGLDNVGLDYQKCYFQATGENFIYLVTNREVIYNGQPTKKVRIQSGAEVTISIRKDDPRLLYIRFDSRMTARRRPSAPGGRRPPQPRRR